MKENKNNEVVKYILENYEIKNANDIAEALSLADRIIVLSKRPAVIKKIYDIDIEGTTPMERRKSSKFAPYYDLLWKELDKNV